MRETQEKSHVELSRRFGKLSELSDEECKHMMELESLIADSSDKEAQKKRIERTDKIIANIKANFPDFPSCNWGR